jgi:hypothetical protein
MKRSPWKADGYSPDGILCYGPQTGFFFQDGYARFKKIQNASQNSEVRQVPRLLGAGVQNVGARATSGWRCIHTQLYPCCYSHIHIVH